MIPWPFGGISVEVMSLTVGDQQSTVLQRVPLHLGGLTISFPKSRQAACQSGWMEERQQAFLPAHRLVAFEFGVTENQAIHLGQVVFAKNPGKVRRATGNEHQSKTGFLNRSELRPELGRLLATEDSAEVSQPDQDGRIELRQAPGLTVLVQKLKFHA